MDRKIRVGILGATGMVGQNYMVLLENHPWFELSWLAASHRSAGQIYGTLMKDRWRMESPMPTTAAELKVHSLEEVESAAARCDMIFSAFSMGKEDTIKWERAYAEAGLPVVSNNSAHRLVENVPILMPEVNSHLLEIIPQQQQQEGWSTGFIVTKPNCGVQSYVMPMAALRKAGYSISQIITTNLQALSGAGYPGQSAMDVIDNIIPLPSEEEKAFSEPQKIFGTLNQGKIDSDDSLSISSNCIRVPVIHGHSSCVWFQVEEEQPPLEDLQKALEEFRGEPQELNLPSAPNPPIRFWEEEDRPQPRLDRDEGNGMTVNLGRLKKAPVMGYRFTAMSHNTRRGAAGGGVLTAELLAAKGYIGRD